MKKYFIIAVAALVAMCACTKNEPVFNGPQKEVSFQVANYMSQTKADDPIKFNQDETFGVYAWYDSEDEENTDEQNQAFMVNETVKYSDAWKVDGKTYYWPKTGDVDFFAYYPVAEKPWIACNDADHKIATTATRTIAATDDLMYSSMAMNYNENVTTYFTSGVPVLFHHALAKLTVNFKKNAPEDDDNVWVITVNSAKFTKYCKAGTLSMVMDKTPSDDPEVIGWDLPTNAIWTPSTDREASGDLVAASSLVLTDSFAYDDLYECSVLPQDLAGMEFIINFTIKASNDGGKTFYSTETVERPFPVIDTAEGAKDGAFSAAGNYWKMNTKITYNVTITPSSNEILFDPAVEDWANVSASKEIAF